MRWVLSLVASALVLGGCGASDPSASEEVSAAVEKTASVGSSRIAFVGDSADERISGEGMIDYDHRRGRLTMEYEPREDNPPPGEILFVEATAYMPTAMFYGDLEGGPPENAKPWVAMGWADQEPNLDTLLFPFPFIDPTRLLNTLEEVSGEVESLGKEDVRGVETEGYRFDIDLRRAIAEAPAVHREALLAELANESRQTRPVELWIDGDGFARRFVVDFDGDEVTLDFYDFDVEVEVEAPPAEQVDNFDDLIPQGETAHGDEEVDSGVVTVEEDE